MKKCLLVLLAFLLLAGVALAQAKKSPNHSPNHVNTTVWLTEKKPATNAIWDIVFDKGYGNLTYRVWGPEFSFQFKGFNLVPNAEYTLIYYPDPWPGTGLIELASGTSNGGGNILLKGSRNTGTLPTFVDENFPGAKIWLVPSEYVDTNEMIGWPTDGAGILFETALINYYFLP